MRQASAKTLDSEGRSVHSAPVRAHWTACRVRRGLKAVEPQEQSGCPKSSRKYVALFQKHSPEDVPNSKSTVYITSTAITKPATKLALLQAKPEQVPLPQAEPDAEVELDTADVDFVHEFGTNLGFLESLNTKQLDKQVQRGPAKSKAKALAHASASDSDSDSPEAAYERAPRQRLQDQPALEHTRLPTKNLHGELVYAKTKSGKSAAQSVKVKLPDAACTCTISPCKVVCLLMP